MSIIAIIFVILCFTVSRKDGNSEIISRFQRNFWWRNTIREWQSHYKSSDTRIWFLSNFDNQAVWTHDNSNTDRIATKSIFFVLLLKKFLNIQQQWSWTCQNFHRVDATNEPAAILKYIVLGINYRQFINSWSRINEE